MIVDDRSFKKCYREEDELETVKDLYEERPSLLDICDLSYKKTRGNRVSNKQKIIEILDIVVSMK